MANVQYKTQIGWDTDLIDIGFLGIEGNELCISANKKTAGAPTATPGVYSPGAQVTNIASGVVYYNTGTTAAPVWSTGGGFSLPITTNLAGGIVATYDQTNNFLGLGLTGAGQTFDTGTGGYNMLASLNTTPFGGAKNTTFIGYLTPGGPGANANIQARYDDVLDESQIRLNTNNLGGATTEIEIQAVPGFSSIEFSFGGGGNYFFPNTSPAVGEVMGYTAPNQLGWVTPAGSTLAIGDAITGATGNRVLFEDLAGNLDENSSFLYDFGSQIFLVGFTGAANAKLYINETSGTYWIGDATGSANKNKLTIDDSNGRIFLGKDPFANPTASYLNIDPLNSIVDLVNPFQLTRVGAPGGAGNGTYMDVQDGTNSIYQNADQFRVRNNAGSKVGLIIDHANDVCVLGDTITAGNGTMVYVDDVAQRISVTKPLRLQGYTVATLPVGVTGSIAYVTDALAPSFLATVVGGGAVVCPVFYNGANWIVG